MLRNYLLTALRNIKRHKAYSFINIAGLAIGLACAFFIALWVRDEISYDRFLEEGDQIYRVMRHATFGGETGTTSSIPKPLATTLVDEYPEVTHTVLMGWDNEMILSHENRAVRSSGRYLGADFFTVFKLPLLAGDPSTALEVPESVALSESLVEVHLGPDWRDRDDLIGTTFRLDDRIDVQLTAVFEDLPANSSLQMDFILPMEEFIRNNEWVEEWGNNGLRMFARLDERADPIAVNAKIKDIIDQHVDQWESDVFLHSINDWYLRSDFENGVQAGGRVEYVRIFLLVAFFIILIASINFMNLATARSAQRAREIGVRKSLGASRWLLARQFLGESLMTALLALVLAMGIVIVLLPAFNAITDKAIGWAMFDGATLGLFGGVALLTGLLAGSYPALYLSGFSVVDVLKSNTKGTSRGSGLRKGLVVFQFAMSIILIVGTFTIYQQLDYIRSKDLGVDRENVLNFSLEGGMRDQFETFKQELLTSPGIVNVTASNLSPLSIGNNTISVEWEGKEESDNTLYAIITTGFDFAETLKMDLVAGRYFSPEFGADSTNYVINEKAVAAMGLENPIGKRITLWGDEGTVVGIVRDFHMQSLYNEIDPVIMRLRPEETQTVFVRTGAGRAQAAIASVQAAYSKFNPEYPLSYSFLDDEFEGTYRAETVIGTLANTFAVLAVLIACLGLFGLASFTAEQRNKEIGIRKVLGASVAHVVFLLSREFVVLVLGAFLLGAPLAYLVMSSWLSDFAFHTNIGVGILVAAGVAAVAIAFCTVSYQSYRAASADPVISLRAE